MKKVHIHFYLLPLLLCFALSALAAVLQMNALRDWYPYLVKPALTPPNVLFPIVWTLLYACIGVSAGLALSSCQNGRHTAMLLWYIQLALNFLWSILFFVCRSPFLALLDILALDAAVVLYIIFSAKVSRAAAWVMVPYLAWVLFATYLNIGLWTANIAR